MASFFLDLVSSNLPSNEPCMSYSVSPRGNPRLNLNGYIFILKGNYGLTTFWACQRKGSGCRVTCSTKNEALRMRPNQIHNHPPPIL